MKGPLIFSLALVAICFATTTMRSLGAPPIASPANFVPPDGRSVFQAGDTMVFLGDSITAQCLYTQYVEDFYYTRFPGTRIHFHNAGTMGDRTVDSFERFEDDVAAFKPQFVSVLFGMNDGNFTDLQEPVFKVFQRDTTALFDRIVALPATPIPMTPTMFDALPNKLNDRVQEPRDKAYNTVLGKYAAWVKEQGKLRNLRSAEVYAPLVDATTDRRRSEADWTMIPDSMHPTVKGHVLIAAAFMNDTAFCPPVSEILIAKKDNEWIGSVGNGELSDLLESGKIAFTFAAKSLPWVLPPEADEGRKLITSAFKKPPNLSSEKLAVRGLAPGKYDLKIDGESVGQWTAAELAAGVDLGENPKTPQYRQALSVALLNKRRNALGEHPMRIDWALLKGHRSRLKEAESETDNPNRIVQAKKSFASFLVTNQKSISDYVAKSREIEEAIHTMSEPEPRKYELSPVAGGRE